MAEYAILHVPNPSIMYFSHYSIKIVYISLVQRFNI